MPDLTEDKPQRLHGRSQVLYDALVAAGIIHEGDYVRRIVIDICVERAPRILIERYGDTRLTDPHLLAAIKDAEQEGLTP